MKINKNEFLGMRIRDFKGYVMVLSTMLAGYLSMGLIGIVFALVFFVLLMIL